MINKMMKKGVDIENVGIMQGFMDSMTDDMEDEGDDEDTEKMMERRPDSPEILMNNLRGDMRSIDARRDELADLVGYQAATETPETVLAMLQPILATQAGGIGALPQSADMAQGPQPPMMGGAPGMPPEGMPPLPPDAGMPPPGMPPLPPDAGMGMAPPPPGQGGIAELIAGMGGGGAMPGAGMPPSDQPPMAMAQGGFVQNFQVGSDELGVRTPEEALLAERELVQYPPDMVAAAKTASMNLFNQAPATLPTLESSMEKRLPQYSKILGTNKGESEAQLLFDLGQRAFNFASNTDDAGRPLRGSFTSRLAGAVKTLPASMGKRVDEINKIDRQIKMLSLQQGEKDIDQIIAQNEKLQTRKATLVNEINRNQGRIEAKKAGVKPPETFGKGDWQWGVVNTPDLMDRFAIGATNPIEDKLVYSAITKFKTPVRETRTDPVTKEPYTVETLGTMPDFVAQAEAARIKFNKTGGPPASSVPAGNNVSRVESPASVVSSAPRVESSAPVVSNVLPAVGEKTTAQTSAQTSGPSLWNDRFKLAGPLAAAAAGFTKIPYLGDPLADITLARENAELQAERLIETFLKSTQGSVTEQKRLQKLLNISPAAFKDPTVYGTQLIAVGDFLRRGIEEFNKQGSDNSGLTPAAKGEARVKAMEYRKFYNELGLPPAVYSQAEVDKLDPGSEFLWKGLKPFKKD